MLCRTSVLLSQSEQKYFINVPNQFIELRPFSGSKGNSGIESLLEDVTDRQIEEAISLVNGKVILLIFLIFRDMILKCKALFKTSRVYIINLSNSRI